MLNCNPASTPSETGLILEKEGTEEPVDETMYKKIVGSLRYLCHTRPDIEFSVGVMSRFMQNPREPHLLAAKRILRYVKGTMSSGILFPQNNTTTDEIEVAGFTDTDWGANKDDRRSTTGFVFFVEGGPISWSSKKEPKQGMVKEGEEVALVQSGRQPIWRFQSTHNIQVRKV
uniref:Retrovirus-related Pol polyprotein from transposon TNT 1-94 n=1 Tax=Cajanus cajan TaxID=3821 RepID=A0A151RHK3_CAJCA|nr:hypothetical protein KK1_036599 [Cajanus cajan]